MDINEILKDLERNVGQKNNSSIDESRIKTEDSKNLVQCWIAERTAPELLSYANELIDRVLKRLRDQIEIIEMNSIELESSDDDIKLKLLIIENEIERVNFLIRSYLRCRLQKIDQCNIYISQNSQEQAKLSSSEFKYMNAHLKVLLDLYNKCFLQDLPEHLQSIDDTSGGISMITQPNTNKFVFIKVITDTADPVRFGEQEIILDKHDIHTIQYKFIKKQLNKGDVVLI